MTKLRKPETTPDVRRGAQKLKPNEKLNSIFVFFVSGKPKEIAEMMSHFAIAKKYWQFFAGAKAESFLTAAG